MTENTVHTGKVIPRAKSAGEAVSAFQGWNALQEVVNATRECIAIHEVERSKRARLEVYRATEIERIRAGETVLREYFSQVFAERKEVYHGLFARMDAALEAGDNEALSHVVLGIVAVAKTSPLADIGDLRQVRAALDDPDQVWEL